MGSKSTRNSRTYQPVKSPTPPTHSLADTVGPAGVVTECSSKKGNAKKKKNPKNSTSISLDFFSMCCYSLGFEGGEAHWLIAAAMTK